MKNMKKRILSGLLCLVMSLTLLPTAAFAAARFTDVPEDFWCYEDVELAVREGLVNGTTPTTYSPNKYLTYGAAIKLAACMHKRVTTGSADFPAGDPWYKPYLDYAKANGIVTKDYPMKQAATRADYMEIFARAIPDTGLQSGYKALTAVNRVDENTIPDVPSSHPQAEAIYKLYRAGILQGSDAAHSCNPNGNITRGAVAAILARIMDPSKRIRFEMVSASGMTVAQQPTDATFVANGKAEFAVTVSGGKGPYTYKWFKSYDDGSSWVAIVNDVKYSGVATAKLTVKLDVTDATSGSLYRCTVTDAARATVTTRSVSVVSSGIPLTFVDQPQDVTAAVGSEVFFDATAAGGKLPYTFQWQRKASNGTWQDFPPRNSGYESSKTNQLLLTLYDEDFSAGYSYRCKITDSNGTTITSTAATITRALERPVNGTPTRPTTGSSTTDTSGSTTDTGTSTPSRPSTTVSTGSSTTDTGTSTPSRPSTTVSTSTDGLRITKQPVSASAAAGTKVSLAVEISGGKGPFTYQWQCSTDGGDTWLPVANSTKYSGVSSATLKVKIDGTDTSSRLYRCKISDAAHTDVYSSSVTATYIRPTVAGG